VPRGASERRGAWGPCRGPHFTRMKLEGRVAVVTGGAKGIGGAIVRAFADEGARVAALDVDRAALDKRVGELTAAGRDAVALTADVTRSADVTAAVESVVARWGRVDVLVNNAGGFGTIRLTEEIAEEEWDRILRLNLTSAFLCSKAVLPIMKRQRSGAIVNLSSIGGRGGGLLLASHYTATKAAILGFTRHLALEVAETGIRVNAVAPGTTATERFRALRTTDETEALAARVPMRRVADPAEVAACIVFLASDAASYVTGACLDVNGGILML
jgi:NAD(P)-dependent dehydrogenase (short-subunit alcohol dehydrogenase family)